MSGQAGRAVGGAGGAGSPQQPDMACITLFLRLQWERNVNSSRAQTKAIQKKITRQELSLYNMALASGTSDECAICLAKKGAGEAPETMPSFPGEVASTGEPDSLAPERMFEVSALGHCHHANVDRLLCRMCKQWKPPLPSSLFKLLSLHHR